MRCQKCGYEVGSSNFCSNCGARIIEKQSDKERPESMKNEPYKITSIPQSQIDYSEKKKPNAKKILKITIPIIASILLLTIIIIVISRLNTINSKDLIGIWTNKNNSESSISFFEDGTGKFYGLKNNELFEDSISFKWKLEKDNLLLSVDFILFNEDISFKAEKKGDRLILTTNDDSLGDIGAKSIWVRGSKRESQSEEETKDDNTTDTVSGETKESITTSTTIVTSTEEKAQIDDKDFLTKTYIYDDGWGATYYFIVIKNNSKQSVSIDINGVARDSSNKIVGAADEEIDILGPGEETLGYLYFDEVENVTKVDCTYSYNTKPYYTPCISNLQVEKSVNSKNVVVSVTNKGYKSAEFVKAYALFFDSNNNVVDFDYTYVTDSDSEIKPEATLSVQLDTYEDFSSVSVYLTGRSD